AEERHQERVGGQLANGTRAALPRLVLREGNGPPGGPLAILGDDADEAARVTRDVRRHGDGAEDGEDAGVDADPDGEGEDHDGGEQRTAPDEPHSVADILEKRLDEG